MKSIMLTLSLFVCSTVLHVHAGDVGPSTPSSSVVNTQTPPSVSTTTPEASPKQAGFFAYLTQLTFKKAFALVAGAGIITAALYKLYEFCTADEQQKNLNAEEQETLTLTDRQRELIDDFAAAVDACDLVTIQAFDFEEFPIDIMLLLHWARMDVLAVHEQQADQEAIQMYRHSMALALRGLAHPDDMPAQAATKDLALECA
jgi:hypothetical protein